MSCVLASMVIWFIVIATAITIAAIAGLWASDALNRRYWRRRLTRSRAIINVHLPPK